MKETLLYRSPHNMFRAGLVAIIVLSQISYSVVANSASIPPQEDNFISIVSLAQADAKSADNDMQKGGIKAKRDRAICNVLANKAVKNWVGKVQKVSANSDGKGVLEISLAKNITVKTWNNDFSDASAKTLINPGSNLFQSASMLKKGQSVTFSGTFLPGKDGECIYESSMSLSGKLRDPEFIFRFSNISAN
ncbi:hypothetical protein PSHI8_13980 [Polynucleobacter sp. SHI8]|uniref:hypothetical protein n=1 Tax=unclassified Polynucleobacter TaxID=2640945 RepID=UPI002490A908|nr:MULTISPECIES: hypothetical protein [unclassified Polynucleobacter]BDW11316.1 hypothetical protein PSHI2_13980 [Polynucleobacter sp. SHI2]BDW13762.1 hypothetical protein PSHI8_13980 [Polynucleobacter sp. SHI8]